MTVRDDKSRANRHNSNVVAAFWMLGTLTSFSLMAIGGRELSSSLSTAEILFFRGIVCLLIISTAISTRGWHRVLAGQWQPHTLQLHALRNLSHFAGQFAWFYAIALLPLAEVFALEFTVPFWTLIIAAMLLGEQLSLVKLGAVTLGMTGTVIIVQPGFTEIDSATLVLLAGAASYGLSHTLTKKLTANSPPMAILFFMALMQLPMSFSLWFFNSDSQLYLPGLSEIPWIIIVGSTAVSAHYCMAKAFSHADATIVVPMDFLRLPLIATIGALFYAEAVSSAVAIGALCMLAGNLINVFGERRYRLKKMEL